MFVTFIKPLLLARLPVVPAVELVPGLVACTKLLIRVSLFPKPLSDSPLVPLYSAERYVDKEKGADVGSNVAEYDSKVVPYIRFVSSAKLVTA